MDRTGSSGNGHRRRAATAAAAAGSPAGCTRRVRHSAGTYRTRKAISRGAFFCFSSRPLLVNPLSHRRPNSPTFTSSVNREACISTTPSMPRRLSATLASTPSSLSLLTLTRRARTGARRCGTRRTLGWTQRRVGSVRLWILFTIFRPEADSFRCSRTAKASFRSQSRPTCRFPLLHRLRLVLLHFQRSSQPGRWLLSQRAASRRQGSSERARTGSGSGRREEEEPVGSRRAG